MTAKRDLKRRVRQRQARTGEAYVTARRHVLAAGPGDPGNDDPETDASALGTEQPAVEPDGAGDGAAEGAAGTASEAVDESTAGDALVMSERLRNAFEGGTPDARVASDVAVTDAAAGEADPAGGSPDPLLASLREVVESSARSPAAVPVVELLDVSDAARRVGLVCRVAMFPGLARRVEPASVLARLRALLVETTGDPQALLLSQVALTGYAQRRPTRPMLSDESVRRFIRRARAGMGGISDDGTALAFHIADRDGVVPVLCSLSGSGLGLELSAIDDLTAEPWIHIATRMASMRLLGPMLFVIHGGRWHPVTHDEFLIGRSGQGVHLTIEDGAVSSHHAVVIRRHGAYYLKDLESTRGVRYKGLRIDQKRIEEGDVFQIGDHELRFSFQPERPDD